MHPLARFTVELASPEGGWAAIEVATARARHAAEEMRAEGTPVRFLRSIFVPEDETCFFLYEGPSADAIRAAASRAELGERQVQETITDARRVGQLRSADDSFVKEEP